MGSVRIEISFAEIGRLLRAEGDYSGVRDELTKRMQAVLQQAKATAPASMPAHSASIRIVQSYGKRAVVRVLADSDETLAAEASTGHMARALDAAGGS